MKLSKMIGCLLIVGIISSLGVGTTKGLTASALWGMSAGDALYYKYTSNATGSITFLDTKVEITSVWNETVFGYNFVNATTYTYYDPNWLKTFNDTYFAGFSTTWGWFGPVPILLGFPNPAPKGWTIETINASIFLYLYASGWGFAFTSEITDNVLTYANATNSIILTYDETTGVCLNNTRMKGANLYTKQEYLGDVDPHAETTTPGIAGYTPLAIGLLIGLTSLFIGKRIKNRI